MPEDSPNPKDSEIHELEQANAALEKVSIRQNVCAYMLVTMLIIFQRLSQALLANEVSDSTHKSALRDLEEAQTSVTRLSAYHARTVGLDTRLMVVMREKDDIQQERDSETQRARVAESRISALKERTSASSQCFRIQSLLFIYSIQPNCRSKFTVSSRIWNKDDNIGWSCPRRSFRTHDLVFKPFKNM